MAERGGFEPPVVFSYSRFPGVRLKPLSHLSAVREGCENRATMGKPIFPLATPFRASCSPVERISRREDEG